MRKQIQQERLPFPKIPGALDKIRRKDGEFRADFFKYHAIYDPKPINQRMSEYDAPFYIRQIDRALKLHFNGGSAHLVKIYKDGIEGIEDILASPLRHSNPYEYTQRRSQYQIVWALLEDSSGNFEKSRTHLENVVKIYEEYKGGVDKNNPFDIAGIVDDLLQYLD